VKQTAFLISLILIGTADGFQSQAHQVTQPKEEDPVVGKSLKPRIAVNYWSLINKEALAAPEDERAWPIIRDALIQYIDIGQFPNWVDSKPGTSLASLTPKQLENIRADQSSEKRPLLDELFLSEPKPEQVVHWLDTHSEFVRLLRAASRCRQFGYIINPFVDPILAKAYANWTNEPFVPVDFKENPWILGGLMPHLQITRMATHVLLIDAELAIADGDPDRATNDLTAAADIAGLLASVDIMISTLVSIDMQEDCAETVIRLLHERPDVVESELDLNAVSIALRQALEKIDLSDALHFEVFAYDDCAQRVFSDDGHGGGSMTRIGLEFLKDLNGGLPDIDKQDLSTSTLFQSMIEMNHIASRAEDRKAFMAYIDAWKNILNLPTWERPNAENVYEVFFEHSRRGILQEEDKPIALCAGTLLGAFELPSNKERQLRCKVAAALLAIAIHQHRVTHGAWPASLQDIDPDFMPGLFIDAYTGRSLLYEVTENGPIIYSAGADRDNDHARQFLNSRGQITTPPWVAAEDLKEQMDSNPTSLDGDWVLYPPSPKP
jgi:hypothetical protein